MVPAAAVAAVGAVAAASSLRETTELPSASPAVLQKSAAISPSSVPPSYTVLGDRENLSERRPSLLVARAAQPGLENRHDRLFRSAVYEHDEAKPEFLLVFVIEIREAQEKFRRRRVPVIPLFRE